MVHGSWFSIQDSGLKFEGSGSRFKVLLFIVQCVGFRVESLELRMQNLGVEVLDLGLVFRV